MSGTRTQAVHDLLNYGHGWLAHEDAVRNLELFAGKVMPLLRQPSGTGSTCAVWDRGSTSTVCR
jgi:hypothetical protein